MIAELPRSASGAGLSTPWPTNDRGARFWGIGEDLGGGGGAARKQVSAQGRCATHTAVVLFLLNAVVGLSQNFYGIATRIGVIALGSVFSKGPVVHLVSLTLEAWKHTQIEELVEESRETGRHLCPWMRGKNTSVGVPADDYKDILFNTEVDYAGIAARGCAAGTDSPVCPLANTRASS